MKKIAIGSHNPVKIAATRKAFLSFWPKSQFEFLNVNASSGVSDQPMSDRECIKGARNRAKKVLRQTKADYGVGIEGGICKVEGCYFARAWAVVIDKKGNVGFGSSISAPVATKLMKLIHKGIELGKANDILTGRENTKQKEGYFGLISDNIITREKGYIDAVIMALAPFKNKDIFSSRF